MGRPIGCLVSRTRGGFMASRRFRNAVTATMTVEIPDASRALAKCPTDTWHTGQTGTSRATSISCCFSMSVHWGQLCLSRRVWAQAPTKE